MKDARQLVDPGQQLHEEPWIAARDAALLTLLYACGLRISEALRITAGELCSASTRRLIIAGKGGKTRLVPLLPAATSAVMAYRRLCPYPLPAGEPLFRGARGGPLNPGVFQRELRRLRAALDLPESVTPHALRHSFATHLLGAKRSAESRSCSAIPACPRPRSTPQSTQESCWKSTIPPIPAP